jgi:hypothetical protein
MIQSTKAINRLRITMKINLLVTATTLLGSATAEIHRLKLHKPRPSEPMVVPI